jgi:serine/threonine protein kinase
MSTGGGTVGASGFAALPQGTVLDRYRIDSLIAAGGFGITYFGHHVTLGNPLAIKEHFPRQLAFREVTSSEIRPTDPDTYAWALDRFVKEGKTLARCRHPGVVTVADVFTANGTAYMVLGYEEGRSLKDWLARLGRTPTQSDLDRILAPLLDALAFVHAQGLLHRDIAPDNIIIRDDGSPCLIDFGAARQAVAERSAIMSAIVKSGFSPPEQYTRSGRAQGPWSDIYALGATLYRAITGEPPTEATDRQIEDDLRPVAELVPAGKYRATFLAAIDHALRLQPSQRPQSVDEWRPMLIGPALVGVASEPRPPLSDPVSAELLPDPVPAEPLQPTAEGTLSEGTKVDGGTRDRSSDQSDVATKPAKDRAHVSTWLWLARLPIGMVAAVVFVLVFSVWLGSKEAGDATAYGEGIDISGPQLSGDFNVTQASCSNRCRSETRCVAYSHHRSLRTCTWYLSISSASRSPDHFSEKIR